MAEAVAAVALGASVVSFVQLTGSVTKRVKDFYGTTQDVPRTLQDISSQLPIFKTAAENVRNAFNDAPPPEKEDVRTAVDGYMRQVTDLEHILSECLPVRQDSAGVKKDNRLKVFWKAIRSARHDRDVKRIRHCLMSYESTLSLYAKNYHKYPQELPAMPVPNGDRATNEQSTNHHDLRFEVAAIQAVKFIGRTALLKQISESFTAENRTVVLLGMGGQGKTQAALEYCYSVRQSFSVYWVDATNTKLLDQGFERMFLVMTGRHPKSSDNVQDTVLRSLDESPTPFLLVFDNFDSPNDVHGITRYIPRPNERGQVLFTSRHRGSNSLGTELDVPPMSADEGKDLLFHRSRCERTTESEEHAKAIVEHLYGLPLALEQAAAYILSRNLPLAEFLDIYKRRCETILRYTPEVWAYQKLSPNEKRTRASVFTTWELSLSELGDAEERSPYVEFLSIVAFMNFREVSKLLIGSYFGKISRKSDLRKMFTTDEKWDGGKYQDFVTQLRQVSLIQCADTTSEEMTVTVHPLVAEWLRLRLQAQGRQLYCRQVIDILCKGLKDEESDWYLRRAVREELYAHIIVCITNDSTYLHATDKTISEELKTTLRPFCHFFILTNYLSDAQSLLDRAVAICKVHRHDFIEWNFCLGHLYHYTSSLQKTLETWTFAYKECNAIFGLDDSRTRDAALELANVYIDREEPNKAEEILTPLLEWHAQEGTLSNNHKMATMLHARLLCATGEYATGMQQLETVLESYEAGRGEDGNSANVVLGELALAAENALHFDRAVELWQRAAAQNEMSFGKSNCETVFYYDHLARVYKKQGNIQDALSIFDRLYGDYTRINGMENYQTMSVIANLRDVYLIKQDFAKAESILQDLLALSDARGTSTHYDTLEAIGMVMHSYYLKGFNDKVIEVYGQVKHALGEEDMRTGPVFIKRTAAMVFEARGSYEEALPLYEFAARGYDLHYGEDHKLARHTHHKVKHMRRLLQDGFIPGDKDSLCLDRLFKESS